MTEATKTSTIYTITTGHTTIEAMVHADGAITISTDKGSRSFKFKESDADTVLDIAECLQKAGELAKAAEDESEREA